MTHDECVRLVVEEGVRQDQIGFGDYFTADNPMWPDVEILLGGCGRDQWSVIRDVAETLRVRVGHAAADWFGRAALECPTYNDLVMFARTVVRAP